MGWQLTVGSSQLAPAASGSEAEVEEREERESSTDPGLSQTVSSIDQRAHLGF